MTIQSVRTLGLLKFAAGAAGFALVFWLILTFGTDPGLGGLRGRGGLAIAAGLPGAFAVVGLIELCAGVRFAKLANYWDALEGWQRGTFGTLVAILALALTFGITLGLAWLRII